jgi:hypothetical protein
MTRPNPFRTLAQILAGFAEFVRALGLAHILTGHPKLAPDGAAPLPSAAAKRIGLPQATSGHQPRQHVPRRALVVMA